MKRFLALVSAVAVCLCSFSFTWAAELTETESISSAAQVQELEETDWFCEEHQQPLIPEDEIPEGYEQICLQCNPVNEIQTMALSDQVTIPVAGVAYAEYSTGPWTNAPSVIGEGQQIAYMFYAELDGTVIRIIPSRPLAGQTDGFTNFGFYFGRQSITDGYPPSFSVSTGSSTYYDATVTYETITGNSLYSRRYNGEINMNLYTVDTLYLKFPYFDRGYFYIGGFTASTEPCTSAFTIKFNTFKFPCSI